MKDKRTKNLEATDEAKRFIRFAEAALDRIEDDRMTAITGCRKQESVNGLVLILRVP